MKEYAMKKVYRKANHRKKKIVKKDVEQVAKETI